MSFEIWKGERTLLYAPECAEDFDLDTGFVLPVYHGTTHTFDVFDVSKSWSEGQFGSAIYLTTSHYDALTNYTDSGPDLKQRIEQRAEHMVWDIEQDKAAYFDPDVNDGPSCDDIFEMAKNLAQKELTGSCPDVLELYVRSDAPFILNADKGRRAPTVYVKRLPGIEDLDIDLDIDPDDPGYDDAWAEAQDEMHEERWAFLHACFQEAADQLGVERPEIPFELLSYEYDGTTNGLETLIKDKLCDLEDPETGEFLNHAFFAAFVRALGYDSIVLLNANERFSTMDMTRHTHHIHIFEANGQIKKRDAESFDETSPILSN